MLTALIAAAWVGAMVLFVVTVSPTVFAVLSMADASRFLRAYFPRLFRIEITVGLLLALSATISANSLFIGFGVLIAVMAAVNLWVLTDRINAIADALAESPNDTRIKQRFAWAHGASAALFGLGGLLCLWMIGTVIWGHAL